MAIGGSNWIIGNNPNVNGVSCACAARSFRPEGGVCKVFTRDGRGRVTGFLSRREGRDVVWKRID